MEYPESPETLSPCQAQLPQCTQTLHTLEVELDTCAQHLYRGDTGHTVLERLASLELLSKIIVALLSAALPLLITLLLKATPANTANGAHHQAPTPALLSSR
jgi:hypothetical protein